MICNNFYWKTFDYGAIDNQQSNFAFFVNKQYLEKEPSDVCLHILDIGCGNLRDSLFFANKGHMVYAVDKFFNNQTYYSNINYYQKDINLVLLQNGNIINKLFDVIYMRFFLHTVPYSEATDIFEKAFYNLKINGLICIEVRSSNDKSLIDRSKLIDNSIYYTDHNRWLYSVDMLKKQCNQYDLEILYLQENNGFSKTENEDPVLIRLICRKKHKDYLSVSPNYFMYQDLSKHKNRIATLQLQAFSFLHNLLVDNSIKYSSVAGTTLGLFRHGGVIPWDDDIDLGFDKDNFDALVKLAKKYQLEIKDLTKFDYPFVKINDIDCFLLSEKNHGPNFMCGAAKTFCTIDEWNNLKKQKFADQYIYAPLDSKESLIKRYSNNYYNIAKTTDCCHFDERLLEKYGSYEFTLSKFDRHFLKTLES